MNRFRLCRLVDLGSNQPYGYAIAWLDDAGKLLSCTALPPDGWGEVDKCVSNLLATPVGGRVSAARAPGKIVALQRASEVREQLLAAGPDGDTAS